MNNLAKTLTGLFLAMILVTCKEKYEPQIEEAKSNYLVVDGMLINGGLTTIRLSRTRPLNDGVQKPELNAEVSIESESDQRYPLTEGDYGQYSIQLALNSADKYRLRIKTAAGKEYLSDFVPVKITPPIDKVYWEKKDDRLYIYADSHDPENSTRYYRWGFEETWVTSVLKSDFEYINGAFVPRRVETHGTCYNSATAEPLALASTAKLSQDVISQALVNVLPPGSHKLAIKYSILVRQYALEQEAYEYWQAMKKNTEQLGSIFDPQPSYMYGNIYSVSDPEEMVLGYFSACNTTEKRIFVTAQEAGWRASTCILEEVQPADFDLYFGQLGWVPIYNIPFTPIWTAATTMACADCGPNYIKPSWWQD